MSLVFWSGDVGGFVDPEQITPWNTISLDGDILASKTAPLFLVSISGMVGFDVDRRKRKNRSGKKKTALGAKSPQFVCSFIYWTKEQYDAWKAYLPNINPHLAANRMKVHKIYNPFLDDFDITQATCHQIEFPQWQGLASTVSLHFEEVLASNDDAKKDLKPNTDPNASQVAIDKDFISDDGPPVLQSRP